MKKLIRFLFVPSFEGMGMGCLAQMMMWVVIILLSAIITLSVLYFMKGI